MALIDKIKNSAKDMEFIQISSLLNGTYLVPASKTVIKEVFNFSGGGGGILHAVNPNFGIQYSSLGSGNEYTYPKPTDVSIRIFADNEIVYSKVASGEWSNSGYSWGQYYVGIKDAPNEFFGNLKIAENIIKAKEGDLLIGRMPPTNEISFFYSLRIEFEFKCHGVGKEYGAHGFSVWLSKEKE